VGLQAVPGGRRLSGKMLFNSIDFMVFFGVVITLYYVLPKRGQNRMLLLASYFFYGYWDWRFLSLIVFSTVCDYVVGSKLGTSTHEGSHARSRKAWLALSVSVNLGLLGIFKYFDFFVGSLQAALAPLGIDLSVFHLNVVLPVGISFYTFQTLSYSVDIYRGAMKPTTDFFDFALFVAYFPQLVAGPIERARVLLPQIQRERQFDQQQFVEGLHLVGWGLFKKVFVADNLATTVDFIFSMPNPSSLQVLAGIYAFAFQIYCDFSGYSNVARGLAKMMGIELMRNFNHPYASTNPREFWQRWHISLSTWLRDYLYVSLGGNRRGRGATYRNLLITMVLGGLWHGAAWNFVLWGVYQGLLLIGHRFVGERFGAGGSATKKYNGLRRLLWAVFFFQWIAYGWLLFRARSMKQIVMMTGRLVHWKAGAGGALFKRLFAYIAPLLVVEVPQYWRNEENLRNLFRLPLPIWAVVYAALFYLFVFFGARAQSFIYFQF
jgi:alginate O-acetyltransferase complex protein AlgI